MAIVILELEVLTRQMDLAIVGKVDHTVAVLNHRYLAKHPNVQMLSEGSQDQHIRFSSDFSGHEAMRHQVTQHLDWQLQTMWYPGVNNQPNGPGPLVSRILHGLITQLLRLVTPPLMVVQLLTPLQDQGEPPVH